MNKDPCGESMFCLSGYRKYLSCIIGAIFTCTAYAEGTVKMYGSIIETACAIDVGSRDQTIDMGSIPISQIKRDGQGPARPFTIRLVNCTFEREDPNQPDWKYFRVTFDGERENKLFAISGEAKGVGLEIRRQDGEMAVPGQAMSPQDLTQGTRDLIYQLRLVADHHSLRSGLYHSLIRFKLDYE